MLELPAAEPQRLCASADLAERGTAFVFDVLHFRQRARGFVMRYDGAVVGYLNRCLHVPTEMDWQQGEFLDSAKEFIICSIHGAVYEPKSGRCAGGPCGRGALTSLRVEERGGEVYWYPSRDTQPVPSVAPSIPGPPAEPASPLLPDPAT
jgi:nitrite reductase/ring-hydroxylating ferredoxin subunit